jgi:hypothetical protein
MRRLLIGDQREMDIAAQVRQLYKRSIRLPKARQYDRNCVLSMTAAQLAVAESLKIPVKSIVVDEIYFDVGPVACRIHLVNPGPDEPTSTVALAGTLGFCWAAGIATEEIYQDMCESVLLTCKKAEERLLPSIEDGSFIALVRTLDSLSEIGEREYG